MGGRGHRRPSARQPLIKVCYLAAFGKMRHPQQVMPPCDGQLVKCHIIKRTVLRAAGAPEWANPVWVWGCGGPTGIGGHHGMLDHGHRPLYLPRSAILPETEEFAEYYGLTYWLDREYGERTVAA